MRGFHLTLVTQTPKSCFSDILNISTALNSASQISISSCEPKTPSDPCPVLKSTPALLSTPLLPLGIIQHQNFLPKYLLRLFQFTPLSARVSQLVSAPFNLSLAQGRSLALTAPPLQQHRALLPLPPHSVIPTESKI